MAMSDGWKFGLYAFVIIVCVVVALFIVCDGCLDTIGKIGKDLGVGER